MLSIVESDSEARPAPHEAAEQLDQLNADRRWAGLVASTPETFQMFLTGACILSLLLFAAAHARVGPDPDQEGSMAMMWLVFPLVGQGQILYRRSGSWLGVPGKRPQAREVGGLVTAYVVGLVAILWLAGDGVWPAVLLVAVGVGAVAAWASGRWIRRYREEFGYRTIGGLWRGVAIYVVLLGVYTLLFAGVWQLVSAWWSSR
jgi:hypothetical protein